MVKQPHFTSITNSTTYSNSALRHRMGRRCVALFTDSFMGESISKRCDVPPMLALPTKGRRASNSNRRAKVNSVFVALIALALVLFLAMPRISIPALASPNSSSAASAPTAPGVVAGTVNSTDGLPIERAVVIAYRFWENAWRAEQEVFTDAMGNYELDLLQVGFYRIEASDPEGSYLPNFYGDTADIELATELSIAGNTIENIDIALVLGGDFSGQLELNNLQPAAYSPSVRIVAYTRTADVRTADARTADGYVFFREKIVNPQDGAYQFQGLPPGDYVICATINAQLNSAERSLRDCYGSDAGSISSGTPLSFVSGTVIADINFSLGHQSNYGQISGQVTDDAGSPLADVSVVMLVMQEDSDLPKQRQCNSYSTSIVSRYTPNIEDVILCTSTDESGRYSITHVAPTSYVIHFQDPAEVYAPKYYGDVFGTDEAPMVDVLPTSNFADLDMTLSEGGRITGKVLVQNSSPPKSAEISVYKQEDGIIRTMTTTRIDEYTGEYEVTGLPSGSYSVAVSSQIGTYPWGVDLEAAQSAVEVTLGTTVANVDFSLADGQYNGVLQGQITNEGTPLEGIRVELLTSNNAYPEPIYYTETDSEGNYKIEGLGGGYSRRLRFIDSLDRYIEQFYNETTELTEAEAVIIDHDETRTIDVELQQAGGISGNVLDPAEPQRLIGVRVSRRTETGVVVRVTDEIATSEGNFQITGLAPGEYQLDFYDRSRYPSYGGTIVSLLQTSAVVIAGEITGGITGVLGAGDPSALETIEEPTEPIEAVKAWADLVFVPITAQ